MKQEEYVQIEWLCGSLKEAREVVTKLLGKRLIACANLIQGVESHYVWQGKLECSEEVQVLMKTHARCFDPIQKLIHEVCEYEVPPILMIPIAKANPAYLAWLSASIS